MAAVLALDQGTTSSRALVVHQDGTILSQAHRELQQHYPEPGWVEHDPNELFDSTVAAARAALAAAGERVVALGITNQRETAVLWDRRTLEPVGRAIVWQDRRTSARCDELVAAGVDRLIRERTGLVVDPYFSATKLEWMLARPGVRHRAERGELAFGTVDAWLIARLTGGSRHVTDFTNASRTLLFDIHRRDWDADLLALFDVPVELLPAVVPSSGVVGETGRDLFGQAVPIAGVAGDQQAALFGQGCVTPGTAKNTYGTGAFLLLHTGGAAAEPAPGLLTTLACDPHGGPAYALEGSVFIAGAVVQWLRDGLGVIETAAESEALARSVQDTGGVHFVPAFVGLGSPHWNPHARGMVTGLTRGTTRAHLVRAALESMAFSTGELLHAMLQGAGLSLPSLRVDGGATANAWLMQFQADVVGAPVERPDCLQTTALGSAGLAGLATGVWTDVAQFVASRRFERFEPRTSPDERAKLLAGWRRAVGAALHWARGD